MKLKRVYLNNYRNYSDIVVDFNDNLNIIIGNNAQGKTNLLESIYVLAVTKSFLPINDKNLVMFDKKYSLIRGILDNNGISNELEVLINDNGKVVKINKKEIKKLSDYISKMNVIIFSSDCIRVFKDNPSSRRKYFNIQISQINKKYLINLNNYNLLLRQRNEFLKIINVNKKSDIDYFDIINDKYVDLSFEIFNYRKKYIDSVNKYIDDIFYSITGLHGLRVVYNSNISNLDKNMFIEKLKNNFNREIQYKMTFIGPNRDDFYFELDGKNLSIYGSQGQNRTAMLSLKLSELQVIKDEIGEYPILLLDDFMSELDSTRRKNFLENIKDTQVIITGTEKLDIENLEYLEYNVSNGKIFKQK